MLYILYGICMLVSIVAPKLIIFGALTRNSYARRLDKILSLGYDLFPIKTLAEKKKITKRIDFYIN